jgi:hypothetical protein
VYVAIVTYKITVSGPEWNGTQHKNEVFVILFKPSRHTAKSNDRLFYGGTTFEKILPIGTGTQTQNKKRKVRKLKIKTESVSSE